MKYYRHRLYGVLIDSIFPLPAAPMATEFDIPADLTVSWKPETEWNPTFWRAIRPSSQLGWPDLGEASDGSFCITWGNELKVVISPEYDQVCIVSREAKLEFAPTVVVGAVLGYVLFLRGVICLHGSVLERGGRAIGILGKSGAGKSTIAASLFQKGATLLSDDLVVISQMEDRIFVEPGCAGMRLESTAVKRILGADACLPQVPYLEKLLWDFSKQPNKPDNRVCLQATPLDELLYIVEKTNQNNEVAIGPALPPTEALTLILETLYPPGILPLLTQEKLRNLSKLAASVPIRLVQYTKTWDHLSRLVELILP
ncbi:MAG: hypothetical protein HQM08_05785 [Candidatus Riflebacteria bacterium]|nr:hypothetical protein [Candidatus Riflebacteria bacterium]